MPLQNGSPWMDDGLVNIYISVTLGKKKKTVALCMIDQLKWEEQKENKTQKERKKC